MDGEQCEVSPKDKSPEIQCDPIASSSCRCQVEKVDGNRQQPNKQTNDKMFVPDGLHKGSVQQSHAKPILRSCYSAQCAQSYQKTTFSWPSRTQVCVDW